MNFKLINLQGKNLFNRTIDFRVVKFIFNYNEDKEIMDSVNVRGQELALQVNPASANDSDKKRVPERIRRNCVSGVLAEYCWKEYLNMQHGKKIVVETEFTSASKQIDLLIKGSKRKIEVRSSFPKNGIEFAIFNSKYQFDILGPYSNTVKPSEIQKDYYVRVLYPFDTKKFLNYFNTSIEVFLTGGATWELMNDDRFYKEKTLIPEDEFVDEGRESKYRVIPLSLAYDTPAITKIILENA
jgi:hypothetical protein